MLKLRISYLLFIIYGVLKCFWMVITLYLLKFIAIWKLLNGNIWKRFRWWISPCTHFSLRLQIHECVGLFSILLLHIPGIFYFFDHLVFHIWNLLNFSIFLPIFFLSFARYSNWSINISTFCVLSPMRGEMLATSLFWINTTLVSHGLYVYWIWI